MKSFFKKERNVILHRKPAAILLAVLLLCTTGCGQAEKSYQRIDTAMGTVIKETIYVQEGGEDITGQVREEIVKLEEELLSHRIEESEVSGINRNAGDPRGVKLSRKLWDILELTQEVSRKSGGAFDITIGRTVNLWNIDTLAAETEDKAVLPSEEAIKTSLKSAGYDRIELNCDTIYLPEGMKLDLGAVGKGIACDEIFSYLQGQPAVSGAVISVGGSILTYGNKPGGKPWNIGIVNPDDPSSYIGGLTLEGKWCVSTSGDYERFVEVEGVRYHHIIDPATGFPADAGLGSVTVLSRSGALSDALSTACFVLGTEKSLSLLEDYDAFAVFVDHEGNITLSEGMEAYFDPL